MKDLLNMDFTASFIMRAFLTFLFSKKASYTVSLMFSIRLICPLFCKVLAFYLFVTLRCLLSLSSILFVNSLASQKHISFFRSIAAVQKL